MNIREFQCLSQPGQVHRVGAGTPRQNLLLDECLTSTMNSKIMWLIIVLSDLGSSKTVSLTQKNPNIGITKYLVGKKSIVDLANY